MDTYTGHAGATNTKVELGFYTHAQAKLAHHIELEGEALVDEVHGGAATIGNEQTHLKPDVIPLAHFVFDGSAHDDVHIHTHHKVGLNTDGDTIHHHVGGEHLFIDQGNPIGFRAEHLVVLFHQGIHGVQITRFQLGVGGHVHHSHQVGCDVGFAQGLGDAFHVGSGDIAIGGLNGRPKRINVLGVALECLHIFFRLVYVALHFLNLIKGIAHGFQSFGQAFGHTGNISQLFRILHHVFHLLPNGGVFLCHRVDMDIEADSGVVFDVHNGGDMDALGQVEQTHKAPNQLASGADCQLHLFDKDSGQVNHQLVAVIAHLHFKFGINANGQLDAVVVVELVARCDKLHR